MKVALPALVAGGWGLDLFWFSCWIRCRSQVFQSLCRGRSGQTANNLWRTFICLFVIFFLICLPALGHKGPWKFAAHLPADGCS